MNSLKYLAGLTAIDAKGIDKFLNQFFRMPKKIQEEAFENLELGSLYPDKDTSLVIDAVKSKKSGREILKLNNADDIISSWSGISPALHQNRPRD